MYRGIEILSPASYYQNSNWLFQESSREAKWTPEENKRFENALALFDKDTPDRWARVAAMIPGKTVGDVMKQYRELEEDVSDIEAGLIPIPGYSTTNNSFTLDWISSNNCDQGFDDGFKHYFCVGGKRGTSTRPSDQERKKGVPWTEEEHRQFLLGLKKYGKGDWRSISRNFVTTRTPTQVASHAQKYFIRQLTGGKDKRRSSIHDITTVNVVDSKSPSPESKRRPLPDHSSAVLQPTQHPKINAVAKQQYDWKPSSDAFPLVFNPANGSHAFVGPFCGISSYGSKLQEQSLLSGNLRGAQLGPYSSTLYHMQSMHRQ